MEPQGVDGGADLFKESPYFPLTVDDPPEPGETLIIYPGVSP
jgi:hypothetical protein